jgi:hypothetical protein
MVIEILAINTIAVSIRIVPPAQDAGVRKVDKKKAAEPVNAIRGRLSFVSMPVQAINGDDTGITTGSTPSAITLRSWGYGSKAGFAAFEGLSGSCKI